MDNQCAVDGCNNSVMQEQSDCPLHCGKNSYSTDFHNNSVLSRFYDELVTYILDQVYNLPFTAPAVSRDDFRDFLKDELESEVVEKFVRDQIIVFDHIKFPERDSRDHFDYFKLLKKLKGAHFNYCQFMYVYFDLGDFESFFQDCDFIKEWTVCPLKILGNVNQVLYQNCSFNGDVDFSNQFNLFDESNYSVFHDCKFNNEINLNGIVVNNSLFKNSVSFQQRINKLTIADSTIKSKFILNNLFVEEVTIENVEFDSKFEFKENKIKKLNVINSNFSKVFDMYRSEIEEVNFFKSIFSDFAGFECCKLGYESESPTTFKYVTFLSFVNFRNAIFNSGLDLENANLKEMPNFLNVSLSSNNTNRETLRIIKHSFDKVGNHIEANKYFSLEMERYKNDMEEEPWSQEKLVLSLNDKISKFGRSYFRPAFLIVILSLIFQAIIFSYENNYLYKIYPDFNSQISSVVGFFNNVAISFMPFSKFLHKGIEFISLLFYIMYATLIWQLVVSIKSHTRKN
ncbi:hypothetical protein RGL53_004541 [Vibrio parahaemolyticus]|nr:hypothetical protein [Vibrio parahaemolyticus]